MNDPAVATRQQQRLAALYEVGSQLSTTLDLGELLNLVMDATIKLTGAERGFLVLCDEASGSRLQTAAARNVDQKTITGDSMEISRGIVRRVIDLGEPVLTDNAQKDERFAEHHSVISYQLRAIMCAPLRARGRTIGAAYVDNRLHSNVFTEEDLSLLAAFAGQAAVAIENARLFRQTDQALARRVEELTLFQKIDQELNHSLDLDKVLALALEWAVQITGADGGSIGLIEEAADDEQEARHLRLLAYQGKNNSAEERTIALHHPILARVLAQVKPIVTHDVDSTQTIDGSPAAAQLAVPLQKDGNVVGLITLEHIAGEDFSKDDLAFTERLADRAVVAIENARLYAAVQAANDAKSEFVSLVTHELRIPLTSIRGYTDLLLKEMAGPLNDSQRQFLGTVRRNLDRMGVLIRDLSDINRVESGRMHFERAAFGLHDVLRNVAGDLQEAFTTRGQSLTTTFPDEETIIFADRARVAQVAANLLSNANKYTPDGGAIEIQVRRDESMARIDVIDNGIGISEEDQARLFSQFFRGESTAVREQTGWGLGLSIVKKLIEAQGGEVSCSSQLGMGSTFTFLLPLAEGTGS